MKTHPRFVQNRRYFLVEGVEQQVLRCAQDDKSDLIGRTVDLPLGLLK
jgi:hypothetical protein